MANSNIKPICEVCGMPILAKKEQIIVAPQTLYYMHLYLESSVSNPSTIMDSTYILIFALFKQLEPHESFNSGRNSVTESIKTVST